LRNFSLYTAKIVFFGHTIFSHAWTNEYKLQRMEYEDNFRKTYLQMNF
jgi:hypothetical protein